MEQFRKEDFIRFKDPSKYNIDRIDGDKVNIFEILNIENESVEVIGCKEQIPVSDIESILINGRDDFQIYYNPPICVHYVINPSDSVPVSKTDYSYYYDTFKNHFYDDKNFQELIQERNIQYVHEVQHFLADVLHDHGLKINAL